MAGWLSARPINPVNHLILQILMPTKRVGAPHTPHPDYPVPAKGPGILPPLPLVERGPGGEDSPPPPRCLSPTPAYMTQRWDVADARPSWSTGHRPAGKYTYHRVN